MLTKPNNTHCRSPNSAPPFKGSKLKSKQGLPVGKIRPHQNYPLHHSMV